MAIWFYLNLGVFSFLLLKCVSALRFCSV